MDVEVTARLRRVLSGTGWLEQAGAVAATLAEAVTVPAGLWVVTTPGVEPWHLFRHLEDAARRHPRPQLRPRLVLPPVAPRPEAVAAAASLTFPAVPAPRRGEAPPASGTMSHPLDGVGAGEAVLLAAPGPVPADLLAQLSGVRERGGCVVSLDAGDAGLQHLAQARLTVARPARVPLPRVHGRPVPPVSESWPPETDVVPFDLAEHLLVVAVARAGAGASPALRLRRLVGSVLPG